MAYPEASPRPVRVAAKDTIGQLIVELTLAPLDGDRLPDWEPGAHIDLHLPNGLVRQYSLCGKTNDRSRWRVAILHEIEGRGGSSYVHSTLSVGDVLNASGPRNNFRLEPAREYLFIGGGIGITPILPMIDEVEGSGRPWRLVYGGRTRPSMAYLEEVAALGDRVTIWPQDEQGLIDLDSLLGSPVPDRAIYCCGPEPLLNAVEERCAAWPAGALHIERFKASTVSTGPDSAFEVELAQSGKVLTVPPHSSILNELRRAEVDVSWSCEDGTCGSCETTVIAGVPDHRDSVLTPSEREAGDAMMVCVSRAKSERLVLEL